MDQFLNPKVRIATDLYKIGGYVFSFGHELDLMYGEKDIKYVFFERDDVDIEAFEDLNISDNIKTINLFLIALAEGAKRDDFYIDLDNHRIL